MNVASLAAFGLLLVRPGVLVMGTSLLGAGHAPAPVRIGLTVLLALVLVPFVVLPLNLSVGELAIVIVRELAIGLALTMAIQILLAGAEFAGHFAGYQIGLSLGSLIDPQSGVRNNVLAILYANVVLVICFASNMHHQLLRALAESYQRLPVGLGGLPTDSLTTSVAHMLGNVFVIGVRIAAPVIMVLLLVELALGLLARVAPSLNVTTAGAPIRAIVGLLVVAASLNALPTLIGRYVPTLLRVAAETAQAFR
ncbi:MAG: flagellar biosynthetic protein FliR [Vicinamibacterales bacterium]